MIKIWGIALQNLGDVGGNAARVLSRNFIRGWGVGGIKRHYRGGGTIPSRAEHKDSLESKHREL